MSIQWTKQEEKTLTDLHKLGQTPQEISNVIKTRTWEGIKKKGVAMGLDWNTIPLDTPDTIIKQEFTETSGFITTKSLNIKTVAEAVAYANIDENIWKVDRFLINSWEVTMEYFIWSL